MFAVDLLISKQKKLQNLKRFNQDG